jgi:serine/threonine protein kinase
MLSKMCSEYCGILNSQYILESQIGSGGFSRVYKAHSENNIFAAKIFEQYNEEIIKEVEREIKFNQTILESQNHRHFFINYISSSLNGTLDIDDNKEQKCYIVFELAPKGNLAQFIESNKTGLNEKHCKIISYKILKALQALHEIGICHRDIKAENIFLDGERFDVKIGDFGLSNFIYGQNGKILQRGIVGSYEYMAPEVNKGKEYDGEKADIFSTGILIFTLLKSIFPFPIDEITKKRKYYSVFISKKGERYWNILKDLGLEFSPEFKDFFKKMVAYSPSDRPTIEQILNHAWMKEVTDLNEEEFKIYEDDLIEELKKWE